MQLTRIEIVGFKSFRTRTVMVLRPGLTVIIGPNGSGKSNIIDAIRWTLGEQSPHALRVAAHQELIFNGSADHPASNLAQVTLVFDNSDGGFPSGGAEVAVMRRLYRSGDGGYYINNQSVRLKELRQSFANLGMTFSPHSIISQGKSDQLLSAKPDERRGLFEEAAGIFGYRMKYREGRQRLERIGEQAAHVEPMLEEVRRNYEKAEREAEQCEAHRAFKNELRDLQFEHEIIEFRARMQVAKQMDERLEKHKSEREALLAHSESQVVERTAINEQIEQARAHITAQNSIIHRSELEIERNKGEVGRLQAEIRRLIAFAEQSAQFAFQFEERQANLQKERRRLSEKIDETEKKMGERRERMAQSDALHKDVRARHDSYGALLHECEEKIKQLRAKRGALQSEREKLIEIIVDKITAGLAHYEHGTGAVTLFDDLMEPIAASRNYIASIRELIGDQARIGMDSQQNNQRLYAEIVDICENLAERSTQMDEIIRANREKMGPLFKLLGDPQGLFAKNIDLDREINGIDQQIERVRADSARYQTEQRELAAQSARDADELVELRIANERARSECAQWRERIAAIHTDLASGKQKTVSEEERQRKSEEERATHNALIAECEKNIEKVTVRMASEKQVLDDMHASLKKNTAHLHTQEKNIEQINKKLQNITRHIEGATDRASRAKSGVDQIRGRFRELFGEEVDAHIRKKITRTSQYLTSAIADTRQKIGALGNVNYMAPVTFTEIKRRYDLLSTQYKDLVDARADLERVTAEIDRQSTEALTKCIDTVGAHFRDIGRLFFNGGKTRLILDNPKIPLESGIDIEVQPEGNKNIKIEQLSGGERTLAALALLFALHSYSPAHVSIMDEVDATLDERNIGKFITYLQEKLVTPQTLLISHNRSTMSAAQSIVGVTMEETGVSKIVEIAVEDYL